MNLYKDTEFILKKYNLTANKKLGQNFLIDENIVNEIIKKAEVSKEDVIIEIGPGLGTLTKYLLENAKKVICIELDKNMIQILSERFMLYENLEIINDDILKCNLSEIIKKYNSVKIIANLPYYITTPIIMKLLEEKLKIETITVMVQREVAERLCAETGSTLAGAITYTVRYYTNPKIILDVPNTSFIPKPEVASNVISLKVLENPSVKVNNEELLFKIIKLGFMQRRKTLMNALQNDFKKEELQRILEELNIDTKIRGEKLTLEQFAMLCNKIEEKMCL